MGSKELDGLDMVIIFDVIQHRLDIETAFGNGNGVPMAVDLDLAN